MRSHANERVWVVVFDGGRSRILRVGHPEDGEDRLVPVEHEVDDNPPAHEQGRDAPGRFNTPSGGHVTVSVPDDHDRGETDFVLKLAGHVERERKAFDRLVLLAPPEPLSAFLEAAPDLSPLLLAQAHGDFVHEPRDPLADRVETLIRDARAAQKLAGE